MLIFVPYPLNVPNTSAVVSAIVGSIMTFLSVHINSLLQSIKQLLLLLQYVLMPAIKIKVYVTINCN